MSDERQPILSSLRVTSKPGRALVDDDQRNTSRAGPPVRAAVTT